VVVNDGDPVHPAELDDITDPRLVRYKLAANRGPYYAHEVVRRATAGRDDFFAVQDADDVSHPRRLEWLVHALTERSTAPGAVSMIGGAYGGKSHDPARRAVSRSFRHRACHAGLWRSWALEMIGGYYGGFRIGWDTMIVSALALYGETVAPIGEEPIVWVPELLYDIRARPDSLTRSPLTGQISDRRREVSSIYAAMWRQMFARRGKGDLISAIQNRMRRYVTAEDREALDHDAAGLRALL
jgi:hypothetical protein